MVWLTSYRKEVTSMTGPAQPDPRPKPAAPDPLAGVDQLLEQLPNQDLNGQLSTLTELHQRLAAALGGTG